MNQALLPFEYVLLRFFEHHLTSRRVAGRPLRVAVHVAVSGGRDSMALLTALARVARSRVRPHWFEFALAAHHFNHRKRGSESDADENFVADACRVLGVALKIERWGEQPFEAIANFQDAARAWRRARAAEHVRCRADALGSDIAVVALGHHQGDQAESILMHLVRGSGLQGLQGMDAWDEQERIVRPFLGMDRDGIETYVARAGVPFREDSSNAETDYDRNFVRLRVLPLLAELNANIGGNLVRFAENVKEERSASRPPARQAQGDGPCGRQVVPPLPCTRETTSGDILRHVRTHAPDLAQSLTQSASENILAHLHKALAKKAAARPGSEAVQIPLPGPWRATLSPGCLLHFVISNAT